MPNRYSIFLKPTVNIIALLKLYPIYLGRRLGINPALFSSGQRTGTAPHPPRERPVTRRPPRRTRHTEDGRHETPSHRDCSPGPKRRPPRGVPSRRRRPTSVSFSPRPTPGPGDNQNNPTARAENIDRRRWSATGGGEDTASPRRGMIPPAKLRSPSTRNDL